MSLNKKTWHYIKLSTKFKVQMNWHLFNILIGLLVFAVLSSAFGGSSSYSTNEFGKVAIHYVSSDLAFVFVLIWAFVVGWTLARPAFREMDFSFVSNRFTSHMSSILYIGFASVIGGLIGFFSFSRKGIVLSVLFNRLRRNRQTVYNQRNFNRRNCYH